VQDEFTYVGIKVLKNTLINIINLQSLKIREKKRIYLLLKSFAIRNIICILQPILKDGKTS